jgi:hypothetical protein
VAAGVDFAQAQDVDGGKLRRVALWTNGRTQLGF